MVNCLENGAVWPPHHLGDLLGAEGDPWKRHRKALLLDFGEDLRPGLLGRKNRSEVVRRGQRRSIASPPRATSPSRIAGISTSAMLLMSGGMSWISSRKPKSGLMIETAKIADHQSPYGTTIRSRPILVALARSCLGSRGHVYALNIGPAGAGWRRYSLEMSTIPAFRSPATCQAPSYQ